MAVDLNAGAFALEMLPPTALGPDPCLGTPKQLNLQLLDETGAVRDCCVYEHGGAWRTGLPAT
jgi:hypothetical protein